MGTPVHTRLLCLLLALLLCAPAAAATLDLCACAGAEHGVFCAADVERASCCDALRARPCT